MEISADLDMLLFQLSEGLHDSTERELVCITGAGIIIVIHLKIAVCSSCWLSGMETLVHDFRFSFVENGWFPLTHGMNFWRLDTYLLEAGYVHRSLCPAAALHNRMLSNFEFMIFHCPLSSKHSIHGSYHL